MLFSLAKVHQVGALVEVMFPRLVIEKLEAMLQTQELTQTHGLLLA